MGKIINRCGYVSTNNQGLNMVIVGYINTDHIAVKFEDGTIVKDKTYSAFKSGRILNPNYKKDKIERTGEEIKNKQGENIKIIEYRSSMDIDVQFDDGLIVRNVRYNHFKDGSIWNPYTKRVYGVGYFGIGEYVCKIDGKHTKCYKTWNGMLQRCYSEALQEKYPSYKECTVCDDWLCYQVFAKWYEENYIEYGCICNKGMALDKDILNKGNKIYSPDSCIFVDTRINSLFTTNKSNRGNCHIGVSKYKKVKDTYVSCLSSEGKRITLGYSKTIEDAFVIYKNAKEKYIKQIADEYREKYPNFPQKLYDAMYRWEVEITD